MRFAVICPRPARRRDRDCRRALCDRNRRARRHRHGIVAELRPRTRRVTECRRRLPRLRPRCKIAEHERFAGDHSVHGDVGRSQCKRRAVVWLRDVRRRERDGARRDGERARKLRHRVVASSGVRVPIYRRDVVLRAADVCLRAGAFVFRALSRGEADGRHHPDRERRAVVHAASASRRKRQRLGRYRPRNIAHAREIALPRERHRVVARVRLRIADDGIVERQTLVRHRGECLYLLKAGVGKRRPHHDLPVGIVAGRDVRRRHLQLALHLRDVVVAGIRAALESVGKRVPALADHRLRAGEGERRAVLAHEAVAADLDLVRRQWLSVVGLGRTPGCQGNRPLRHRQRAVVRRERVVGGDVRFAAHDPHACYHVRHDPVPPWSVEWRRHSRIVAERHIQNVAGLQNAEVRRLVFVKRVGLPVVSPAAAPGRHGDLRRVPRHRERARHDGERIVGHARRSVRHRERGVHAPRLRDAREITQRKRLALRQGGQTLPAAGEGCACRDRFDFLRPERKRRSVVRLLLRRRGERDCARLHFHRAEARRHRVVLSLRVRVERIGECICHRLGRIRDVPDDREAGIGRALARGESVARHRHAAFAVRRAVIHPLRMAARKRDAARRNRPALLHRARVVARAGDAHHVVAGVRRRVAGERVGDVVEVAVRLHEGDLRDRRRLLRAVVHRIARKADVPVRRIVADHARRDAQPAVSHFVCHVEVGIGVGKAAWCQPHRRRSGVGARCRRHAAEHRIRRDVVKGVFRGRVIPAHALLGRVVCIRRRMPRHGHRHRPLRDRHLRRVNEVLVVRVRDLVPDDVFARVGVSRHRPPRQGGRPAPADPRASIIRRVLYRALPNHRRAKGHDECIRVDGVSRAVVDNRRVELREPAVRHVALARLAAAAFTAADAGLRHRQRAVHRGDFVVARFRILIERVGEGVLACAHGGLLARERIRRPLTVHKAVAANRHLVRRERHAVVDLRVTLRGERNRARRDPDADRADHRRVVRCGDAVPHLCVADVRVDRRRIDPVLGLVRAVLHHRRREEAVRRHGDAMRRAVVDVRVADRRDNAARPNRNRRGDDRNLARDDRDRVVREVCPFLRDVIERVLDFALGDRRHRRPVRGDDPLARHEVVTTFYKMWERMWLAVVHEVGLRARGQRDRAFRNRHLRRMYEIFVVRVRHPVPHHVFARVGVNRRRPPRQGGRPAPADPRASIIRRVLHRVLPNHRRAKGHDECIRVDGVSRAVVDNRHIELREPAVRHVALARLAAATFTAADVGLRHRERAIHGGDVVVARLRAVVERVGEGVFAHSYGGLLARERIRRPLTVHKTVAANRHLVRRKRRAVVDLRVTLRGERNRARRDPDADRADNRRVVRSRDPIPHLRVADVAERR